MASIQNSKAKFYERALQTGEEGKHIIESEADLYIKELSQKQLDTNITLEQQLTYKKEFQSCHIYQPENRSAAGIVSLHNFKEICANEEISHNNNEIGDRNLLENQHISRHVKELALAVKPNSLETKLLKFAISCSTVGQIQSDIRPHDHPINRLNDIENSRFGHLSDDSNPRRTAKTILRKRHHLLESISEPIEIKQKPVVFEEKSSWDVTEASENRQRSRNRVYTCPNQRLFTIRDQKVVEIKPNEDKPTEEKARKSDDDTNQSFPQRLSEDEIKRLPKFSNYERGTSTETLYVKNLTPSVTENDLSSLFAKYQKSEQPCITYRLMKSGRMRGQAFVNCFCSETAEQALEELNGVFLHGKPIVIQFSSLKKNKAC